MAKKKLRSHKALNKDLDDAWSLLVKLRAGMKCEYCPKTTPLNSHHVYGRRNLSTRWDVNNGYCLCVGHHTFDPKFAAHQTPNDFSEWCKKDRGEKWFDDLNLKAHSTTKWTQLDKTEHLEELNKQIKELQ